MGLRYILQFLLVKNYKIVNESTTTEDREKISTDLESSGFLSERLTDIKNDQILLHEISHKYLVTIR
jgi:hypothetical protein